MKYIIITSFIILIGCGQSKEIEFKQYPFIVYQDNGTGFASSTTLLKCDSFQFISGSEIYVYIDGTKMKVIADQIRVRTN